jgi:myosin heavy subunit
LGGAKSDLISEIEGIMKVVNVDQANWQLGLTKVFMREFIVSKRMLAHPKTVKVPQLEEKRAVFLRKYVVKIQKTWRMYWVKSHFRAFRTSALSLQSAIRALQGKQQFLRRYRATVRIQTCRPLFIYPANSYF